MRYLEIVKPITDTISATTDASFAEALTKQRKSQLAADLSPENSSRYK